MGDEHICIIRIRKRKYLLLKHIIFLYGFLMISLNVYGQGNHPLSYRERVEQYTYVQVDSAYYYADLAIKEAKTNKDWREALEVHYLISDAALYSFDYEKAFQNNKEIDILFLSASDEISQFENYHSLLNYRHYYQGLTWMITSDYDKAINAFEKIVTTAEKRDINDLTSTNRDEVAAAYGYITKLYLDQGKYAQARAYCLRNLRFIEALSSDNTVTRESIENLLSKILSDEKKYKESNKLSLKLLKNFKARNDTNSIISSAFQITENYIQQRKADSARHYLSIVKNYMPDGYFHEAKYYQKNARTLLLEKQTEVAFRQYERSVKSITTRIGTTQSSQISDIHLDIGDARLNLKDYHKALARYQVAIDRLPDAFKNTTISRMIQFKALNRLSETHNKMYSFETSIERSSEAIQLLDTFKPTFRTEQDKLFLIESAYSVFENGLEALYQLYHQTGNDTLIDRAFYITEKSKSTLLLESLLATKASAFAQIPEKVLMQEKLLKVRISNLENRLYKKPEPKLQDQLFEANTKRIKLVKDIEANFPKYYNLKYNTTVISLEAMASELESNEQFVSFFYGTKAIYGIAVGIKAQKFIKIDLQTGIEEVLKESLQLLKNPKSDINVLNAKSNELYTALLKPLLDIEAKHVTISADGLLNYLPFGSLSVGDGIPNYLIEDCVISYANSATLLSQLNGKPKSNIRLLGFAPRFSTNGNSSLLPLPNNTKEVAQVLNYFEGASVLEEKATLEAFQQQYTNYGIIHLATHAIYNDENPEYSYLAFSEAPEQKRLLYANDLYNLNLHANLITLSACDSGVGYLQRGEGLMSLARGFYYGGAQSICSTLWKINDASSASMMNTFYKELAQGSSKGASLQKAKLNFLNENRDNAYAHPYHWAGFIISGNMEPFIATDYKLWYIIGVVVLFLLIIFYHSVKGKRAS